MNIILVGCEFTGKTTLSKKIEDWSEDNLGRSSHFHDHFTIPSTELLGGAAAEYRTAHPQIKEMFQRFMMAYHISPVFYRNSKDHNLMGLHIEEAVYAPLYYGYGGKDSGAPGRSPEGQRSDLARTMEREILEWRPETVLVLMKASPDVIRKRMNESLPTDWDCMARGDNEQAREPTRGVVKDGDVEYVLNRFEEEFDASLIKNKMVIDTTTATVEETLAEFVEKLKPFLTEVDKQRMKERRGS